MVVLQLWEGMFQLVSLLGIVQTRNMLPGDVFTVLPHMPGTGSVTRVVKTISDRFHEMKCVGEKVGVN